MPKLKNFNWSQLDIVDDDGDRPAITALCAFFYLSAPVHDAAAVLADVIEKYVGYVGFESLVAYTARSGAWKKLTTRQYNKDIKHLRDFPSDHIAVNMDYDSGDNGEPGPFGVYVDADQEDDTWEAMSSHVRVDFPVDWLDEHDVDTFLEFFVSIVELDYVESANAGFAFKSTAGSQGDAVIDVQKKVSRFLAFDPGHHDFRYHMLGHTLTAHWVNFVDHALAESIGGPEAIQGQLGECDVRVLPRGVFVRGAAVPPIGDSNRKTPDIGRLPDVARILKPTRLDMAETAFAAESDDFDALAWLERLDDLTAGPWDNR